MSSFVGRARLGRTAIARGWAQIRDVRAAVIIAVLFALTWVVPASIDAATTKTLPEFTDDRATLEITAGSIEFDAPEGWLQVPGESPSEILLSSPDEKRRLWVSVTEGVEDFERFEQREVAKLNRRGAAALLETDTTEAGEFSGHRCSVILPASQSEGSCLIVGRGDLAVTLVATAKTDSDSAALDVRALGKTLVFNPSDDGEGH